MTTTHEIDARRSRAEALMAKLYVAGATDRAMARVLNVPLSWPLAWRKKNDLPRQPDAYEYWMQGSEWWRWEDVTPIRLAKKE